MLRIHGASSVNIISVAFIGERLVILLFSAVNFLFCLQSARRHLLSPTKMKPARSGHITGSVLALREPDDLLARPPRNHVI